MCVDDQYLQSSGMLLCHQRLLPEREKKQLYRHNCTYRLRKKRHKRVVTENAWNGRKGGTGCEDGKRVVSGINAREA
ncbi:hypothetical protein CV876_23300 [Salmonella enterica]|nr:hypothetical protein [Salmonella enterica]EBR5609661.1 hypothetical protein [Salmonella enterica]